MAATAGNTPIRELTDTELRKRLLQLGYDVPVSVNRDFLVKKLENASATAIGGGGGGSKSKRHSLAVTPSSSPTASPSTGRKTRKSMASTPTRDGGSRGRGGDRDQHHHYNNVNSTPMSPLAASSPISPQTPVTPYSPSGMSSIATPATPPPFVSRLGTPSTPTSPNGETGSHSPRYLSYYNMFKASPGGGDGGHGSPRNSGGGGDGGYGYAYNRSIRLSAPAGGFSPVTSVAPPSKTDRNGYAAGAAASLGVETDWCGGTFVSKILVGLFVTFFLIIGGLYVRQSMIVDPRGLTGAVGNANVEVRKQAQPAPPVEKKTAQPPPPLTTSMTYPICGLKGVDPEACIPKEIVKNSRTLFTTLKNELTQRARRKGCSSDVQDSISLQDAKSSILYTLTDLKKGEVDAAFHGMLLLIIENPKGGLSLEAETFAGKDLTPRDAAKLDMKLTNVCATNVHPDFICEVFVFLTSLTMTATLGVASAGAGYLGWKAFLFYKKKKKSEEDEIFLMVEQVLDYLGKHYELSEASQGTPYLAVNHVRDELMPPKERQKKEALWNKVVDYISNHESRIREEIQHIQGEEFKVWRWLPSASPRQSPTLNRFSTANSQSKFGRFSLPMNSSTPILPSSSGAVAGPSNSKHIYPSLSGIGSDEEEEILAGPGQGPTSDSNSNNKWQGQAFETCEGSPNALPTTPTTCLKIRHMFTERDTTVNGRSRIEQEILGKCRNAKILHIGMDPSSVEGCVYIRCLTKDDARKAFMSLHGWWFDGHLLSVKFLKEERYFSRFPEAKNCTVPMGLSR